jgi:hypothetical protein
MTRRVYTVSKSREIIYVAVVERRKDGRPANSTAAREVADLLGGGRFAFARLDVCLAEKAGETTFA